MQDHKQPVQQHPLYDLPDPATRLIMAHLGLRDLLAFSATSKRAHDEIAPQFLERLSLTMTYQKDPDTGEVTTTPTGKNHLDKIMPPGITAGLPGISSATYYQEALRQYEYGKKIPWLFLKANGQKFPAEKLTFMMLCGYFTRLQNPTKAEEKNKSGISEVKEIGFIFSKLYKQPEIFQPLLKIVANLPKKHKFEDYVNLFGPQLSNSILCAQTILLSEENKGYSKLKYFSAAVRADAKTVESAVKFHDAALRHASKLLRKDIGFCGGLARAGILRMSCTQSPVSADKDTILTLLKALTQKGLTRGALARKSQLVMHEIPERLQRDEAFLIRAVQTNYEAIEGISPEALQSEIHKAACIVECCRHINSELEKTTSGDEAGFLRPHLHNLLSYSDVQNKWLIDKVIKGVEERALTYAQEFLEAWIRATTRIGGDTLPHMKWDAHMNELVKSKKINFYFKHIFQPGHLHFRFLISLKPFPLSPSSLLPWEMIASLSRKIDAESAGAAQEKDNGAGPADMTGITTPNPRKRSGSPLPAKELRPLKRTDDPMHSTHFNQRRYASMFQGDEGGDGAGPADMTGMRKS